MIDKTRRGDEERMSARVWFQRFYLDKEKDIIVELFKEEDEIFYVLRTPNHGTGNLISNLAKLCGLPVTFDEQGLKIIEGKVPCYIDGYNRTVYIFRLGNTKVANIFPDGTVEMKASVPAISKTLMSQTKDYRLDIKRTIVKTFILNECKFRTDLHTHMNANLKPDILIALGIAHQIRYPLYYIKKLKLRCTEEQKAGLSSRRKAAEKQLAGSELKGKYLTRRIDDNTFINFADLILNDPEDAAYNIAKIRASLSILKDGQAVFTNLEKVYLYRYVFTKGVPYDETIALPGQFSSDENNIRVSGFIPDSDIAGYVTQILRDRENPDYADNSIFQDKLLWIARSSAARGIRYLEISDTTLVKNPQAADMLAEVHQVMPAVMRETGVVIRFLAAIRRIALTIIKDKIVTGDYFRENLQVLRAIACDPYVAGSDIIGEEINDIRELQPVIREIVRIAGDEPSFVVRIHAGENDSLPDNVANSIACVKESLEEGQPMPRVRIGHGLYTAKLNSRKGQELIRELKETKSVLEFQITSNVRLNNLNTLEHHPLRQYLKGGVWCVQGTDGGALYGTDSLDEQLSLEKLLNLSTEELRRMRECEEQVCEDSLRCFSEKQKNWKLLSNIIESSGGEGSPAGDIASWYRDRIAQMSREQEAVLVNDGKLVSAEVMAGQISPLPAEGMPVVLVGGSFNNDRRATVVREEGKRLIDEILRSADPDNVFFVIGHRHRGYERYLLEQNAALGEKGFRVYSMIPTMITPYQMKHLKKSGTAIRISIEPSEIGLYKSCAYEVFKQRRSILLALDGNSAGANMIQEAKNAKYKCRIYVSAHSRLLRAKAESLEGYVTVFSDPDEILPHLKEDLKGHR